MKTQAAVLNAINTPFEVVEVELDPPGPGEALVKMAAAGVCHSDWHVVDGTLTKELPMILGHEGSGEILEVGEGVTMIAPGDHVILSWVPDCGLCPFCMNGQANLCDGRQPYSDGTLGNDIIRFHSNGQRIRHFNGVSSFAAYSVVPERGAIKIPREMPLDKAALIGCATSTGVGAVIFTAKVPSGATMAVFGCGGVGLNAIQGGTIANASQIIAVDIEPRKLQMAKDLGATDTVNATEGDPVEQIMDLTGGKGVEYSFEAIGRGKTMGQAFACLAKAGTACCIGIARADDSIEIHPRDLVYAERRLIGSFYGSTRPRVDFARFVEMYLRGILKLDELVTRTYPLAEINEAYAAMNAGEVARSLLIYD